MFAQSLNKCVSQTVESVCTRCLAKGKMSQATLMSVLPRLLLTLCVCAYGGVLAGFVSFLWPESACLAPVRQRVWSLENVESHIHSAHLKTSCRRNVFVIHISCNDSKLYCIYIVIYNVRETWIQSNVLFDIQTSSKVNLGYFKI